MQKIQSTEINYLIYRYFIEQNLEHSAFVLLKESQLDLALFAHADVEREALILLLHRALRYTEIETHLDTRSACTNTFSLVHKHSCSHREKDAPRAAQKRSKKKEKPSAKKQLLQDTTIELRHSAETNTCVWSPAGKKLLSGSRDTTARVWNIDTFSPTPQCIVLQHVAEPCAGHGNNNNMVTAATWSPDGMFMATGTYGGICRLWKHDGSMLGILQNTLSDASQEVPMPIYVLRWCPAGECLLAGTAEKSVLAWRPLQSLDLVPVADVHTASILDVDWKDKTTFASCSKDGSAYIQSIDGSEVPVCLQGHQNEINSLKWSAQTQNIATGSDDCTARVWHGETGACLLVLEGHAEGVFCVAWSEHSEAFQLATASYDTTVRVWSGITGELLHVLSGHTGAVHTLGFAPRSSRLVSGSSDGTVRVWSVETGAEERMHSLGSPVVELGWCYDASMFAACTMAGSVFVVGFRPGDADT